MIERLRPHRSGTRAARRGAPRTQGSRRRSTAPPLPPPPPAYGVDEATMFGLPAEVGPETEEDVADQLAGTAETDTAVRVHGLRRSDQIAGSLLILAGVAANVALWLPWVRGEPQTGITLVRRGFVAASAGWGDLLSSGVWQPLAVELAGGLLVLLGALLFVPARTHRLVGVLALLVSLAAAAGVISLLAAGDWSAGRFDAGLWCGLAVAVLGLAGSLKAMLTLPRVAPGRDAR